MSASVRDVARRAGVSVGTVSNVLNSPDKVAASTAARVHAVMDELHFVVNGAARQLRAGRSASVGFVVLDVTNPFFGDVIESAEHAAGARGWNILIANSREDAAREQRHLTLFEQQRVTGVLIVPTGLDATDSLRGLARRGIPTVLVDSVESSGSFSSIAVDNHVGGAIAAHHLIETGRKSLLFVGDPSGLTQVRDRLSGARQVVTHTSDSTIDVLRVARMSMTEGVAAGREILRRDKRPDAIFAANDVLALGILQALTILGGVRVPDDIALIGYDDIEFAASAAVPISSIRQPREDIGRLAIELLVDVVAGNLPRQITLHPELVVRRSTS